MYKLIWQLYHDNMISEEVVHILLDKYKSEIIIKQNYMIKKWKIILKLTDWFITTKTINSNQVLYPNDLNLKEFIGINIDFENKYGIIYCTRELTDFDVVHELLHCKNPKMSENEINLLTKCILKTRNNKDEKI